MVLRPEHVRRACWNTPLGPTAKVSDTVDVGWLRTCISNGIHPSHADAADHILSITDLEIDTYSR